MASVALVAVWLAGLFAAKGSGWIVLLRLIGTSAHELAHFLAGLLTAAQPRSFSIIPRRTKAGWVLGAVEFSNLNVLNAAPVALAPLMLAGGSWACFTFWTVPAFHAGEYASWLLSGYVAAVGLCSSVPSSTDLRVGAASIVLYAGTLGAAWLLWDYSGQGWLYGR